MWMRVFALAGALCLGACSSMPSSGIAPNGATPRADAIRVTAPGLAAFSFLAKKNEANTGNCSGGNVSPPLQWSNWPAAAQSFAVMMSDPDGGRGRGSTHWIAYNIPLSTNTLAEGAGSGPNAPFTQGKNQAGLEHYRGPCPTLGDQPHHYVFGVYALDVAPGELPPGLDRETFLAAIASHSLSHASIVLRYAR